MSVAFILNPGYNTINNVHHSFWNQDEDNIKNDSLNQALEVSTSVKAPIHVVGDTHTISATAGGIITDAPQFEIPIVISSQVNTDTLLPNLSTTGISVQADLVLDDRNITGVDELTCGTLHYTTLDPAITPGDPSTWSEYPATQAVDMASQDLSNCAYLDVKPTGNGLGMTISNTLLDPISSAAFVLQTNGDGSTIPSALASFTLLPSNALNNTWDKAPSSLAVNITEKAVLSCSDFIKVSTVDNNTAFVMNDSGAMSFNTDFNSGTPNYSFGTSGQLLSSNGINAPSWVDAPTPGDPSTWSEYPATHAVDLVYYNLTSSTGVVNLDKDTIISKPLNTLFTVTASDSTSANSGSIITCNAGSDIESYSQFTMACNSGKQDSKGAAGFLTTAGAGVMQSADERELILQSSGANSLATSNIRFAYSGSKKAYTINKDGALNFDADWNGTNPIIEGSFGTAGQIIASQGSALPPQWVAAPTASNWSTYAAISNVDLVSNTLTSSTDLIKLNKDTTISKPLNTIFTVSAPDSTSANAGTVIFATAGSNAESYSQFAMACNSGKQDSKGADGFLLTAGAGVMQSADTRELIFLSGGQNPATTSNIRFAYSESKKAYTINKDGALNFDANWNGTSPIIEGSFGTVGQIIQSNGSAAAPSWVSLPTSSQYVYYVSKDGTVGASGDVNHPLSTIQAAITLGQAAYPRQVVILIAPGVYTETLSITLPNITLSGYSISQQQNLMTQIVGNVGVSCSASQDLFYSQVCFQNLQISGLLFDNSSVVHTLNVEGCRISANGAVFAQLSTADNRTRLTRCTILQSSTTASTDPILKFSSGLITLSLLDVTARNNAPVLQFDGSAKLQACGLCTFESTTTSATAAPIVYIAPTSAAGYTYAFGYNSFSYSSLVPRAFSSGKNCGIVCEAGTGHPTLIITYNAFNLLLCDATCFVVQDVKKADAAAYTDIRFFSNSSTYLATGIDSTHKTTLAAIA